MTDAGGHTPALLLAAHGSRDPRFAHTARSVRDAVAARLPGVEVTVGFLDLDEPSVEALLERSRGRHTVVVPLLLSDAFHHRVDLPAVIGAAVDADASSVITQTPTLADPSLVDVLVDRLHDIPAHDGDGVLLCAVGSSDADADALVARRGVELARALGDVPVAVGFATRADSITAAVADLLRAGSRRIVVSPYFLSAGTLTDRVERILDDAGHRWTIAAPMAAHPTLVSIVCDRYRSTVTDTVHR